MTTEERAKIARDFYRRLPYGALYAVKSNIDGNYQGAYPMQRIEGVRFILNQDGNSVTYTEDAKPYRRRFSSMTADETRKFLDILAPLLPSNFDSNPANLNPANLSVVSNSFIEFAAERHFDMFELIDWNLAIEVTEENNPYKDE